MSGSRVTAVVTAACATLGACTPDRPVRAPLDTLLTASACETETRASLRAWHAGPALPGLLPGPDGSRSLRLPADRFGVWITVSARAGEPPRLIRETPAAVTERRFDVRCAAVDREMSAAAPSRGGLEGFTDADLSAAVEAATTPVVVYVWAPHMPLSVDGLPEIVAAARSLGWPVVEVVMPGSDAAFSIREARRVRPSTAEAPRRADAVELRYRDALVHAPSIVVFSRSRVSPVLPGYRNAAGYVRFLRAFAGDGNAPAR